MSRSLAVVCIIVGNDLKSEWFDILLDKLFGVEEWVIQNELKSEWFYFQSRNELKSGWFQSEWFYKIFAKSPEEWVNFQFNDLKSE